MSWTWTRLNPATLRAALNAAVKQRQISWNPCAGIELEPENPAEAQRWTPADGWGGWGSNPRPADYESPIARRG